MVMGIAEEVVNISSPSTFDPIPVNKMDTESLISQWDFKNERLNRRLNRVLNV